MSKVYSTEALIKILADERRACISGERLCLTASPTGINPLLDKFIKTEGIQKFTAYSNFRAAVHQYQREHQVSGILWQTVTIQGKTLHYPKVDDQLVAIAADLPVLWAAKTPILNFWHAIIEPMALYLSLNGGKIHQPITTADQDRIIQRTEWASLCQQGNAESLEIILQLGWGKPEEAAYRRGFPESGSEYIHAVNPGRQPLG